MREHARWRTQARCELGTRASERVYWRRESGVRHQKKQIMRGVTNLPMNLPQPTGGAGGGRLGQCAEPRGARAVRRLGRIKVAA